MKSVRRRGRWVFSDGWGGLLLSAFVSCVTCPRTIQPPRGPPAPLSPHPCFSGPQHGFLSEHQPGVFCGSLGVA